MEVATDELLQTERDGEMAILTLNRPDQRNALSLELMERVIGALDGLRDDPDVRVVVLAAAGPAFCAGHDLGEMLGLELNGYRAVFDTCSADDEHDSRAAAAGDRPCARSSHRRWLPAGRGLRPRRLQPQREVIDAQTAADWGLVNRVVASDELAESTRALARQIAAASPMTVRVGKRAYYEQIDLDLAGAYEHCRM